MLPAQRLPAAGHPWVAAGQDLLVMGTIHRVGSSHGIGGRSDYRVHRSTDGGNSWELLAMVYSGSASYSGLVALNSTHVGVAYNAGVVGCVTRLGVRWKQCPLSLIPSPTHPLTYSTRTANPGSERASSMSCGAVTKYVVLCARCPGLQTV